MTFFEQKQFRSQFPALTNNRIYLDSAATTLKPQIMITATQRYYGENGATVHRSQYITGQEATNQFESARQRVAKLLQLSDSNCIIWTKGTTEAINLIAQSYARPRLKPGDEIVIAESEHHSNLIPWLIVAQQTGAKIIKLPLDTQYLPNLAQLPQLLSHKTKILALGQMSNVTGGCPDLSVAIEAVHAVGAVIVVDGAQGIVHAPPNVQNLDIDFYAFSAHKLFGPTGVGVLYAKPELLTEMEPWQGGGKMLTTASFDNFNPRSYPHRFEAGTPNIAGIVGFNATLEWLDTIDQQQAEYFSCELAQQAYEQLSTLPGFICYRAQSSSLLPFNFSGYHHADVATLLSNQGISLRSGQHCAQPLMHALGVTGTLRASFAPYNCQNDIDALYDALKYSLNILAYPD